MPDPTVPADAGTSSNAATPAADAALVNAATPTANAVSSGASEMPGSTGTNPAVPPKKTAKAKKGKDGEPIPVGNETQRKVAAAIAATLPKPKVTEETKLQAEKAKTPLSGLNAEIKKIIAAGQTQSAAGPKPAELKPVESPPASGVVTAPVQVKAKGTVTPPPSA